jgi:hypothetical protein
VTQTSEDEQRLRESGRHAPRLFIVSSEQWPRALLRAELRHAGYDAIGAGTLARTLRYPPEDSERGAVRLIVMDERAAAADPTALEEVRRRYPGAQFVLVHRAGPSPPGPWAATLQRPVTIGAIVATARRLVRLPHDPGGDTPGGAAAAKAI